MSHVELAIVPVLVLVCFCLLSETQEVCLLLLNQRRKRKEGACDVMVQRHLSSYRYLRTEATLKDLILLEVKATGYDVLPSSS